MSAEIFERLRNAGWGIGNAPEQSLHAIARASEGFTEEGEQTHDQEVQTISEAFDLAMLSEGSTYAVLSFCPDPNVEQDAANYGFLSATIEESCRNYIDARADLKNGSDYAVDASGAHLVVFTYGAHHAYDQVFVFHKIDQDALTPLMVRWEEAVLLTEAELVAKEAFWNKDAVASDAELLASIRESLKDLHGQNVSLRYYVQRMEPYFGSGLNPVRYKGESLEDAIKAFKELPPAFGDKKREALNVLGVEYGVYESGQLAYMGSCDLIQERFDRPLFLSQDYRVMQVKDIPEVAEKAVGTLKDAFNLNGFGQLVQHPIELDGANWVIRHFHERDLILAECYDAGINVYKQGSVMASSHPEDKEYVVQDSRTGETLASCNSLNAAFDVARSLVPDRLQGKENVEKNIREGQEANRDLSSRQADRSQRWQERSR